MWAVILTAAIGTSPEPDCFVFDCIEHNQYRVSFHEVIEDAPHQTIFWRGLHVIHWENARLDLDSDNAGGCYGWIGERFVRSLEYRDTWNYADPEIFDRHLHGDGCTTRYRKRPSEW